MRYWRDELKDNPEMYRAYANLLDASVNNVAAFEREVRRQNLWEEYQHWRKARDAEQQKEKQPERRVVFSAGKKIISGVVTLFKGKDDE